MFSTSKCPNCQKTGFEMNTEIISGSDYKVNFVRCISCKTVVGLLDYFNAGDLILKLAKKLGKDLSY